MATLPTQPKGCHPSAALVVLCAAHRPHLLTSPSRARRRTLVHFCSLPEKFSSFRTSIDQSINECFVFSDKRPSFWPSCRYLKALAHVSKMVDVTPTQKEQVDPVKESCYLNLAMCWFKLDKMDKCIDNCGECLSINPGNSKALLRRGLAYERERKLDEALADAKQSLKHAASEEGGDSPTPPASGAAGLKERCEAAIKKQNAAQRDTYSRMFAKS